MCSFCLIPYNVTRIERMEEASVFQWSATQLKALIKIKWCFTSTVGTRHGAWCLLYHFLRCLAFVSGYRIMATWHPQPKLPPWSTLAALAAAWGPLGSSGDLGEDTNCRPPFCEETFYNCIFGVCTPIPSHNVNDNVSSSHSCHMVFDCLDRELFLLVWKQPSHC